MESALRNRVAPPVPLTLILEEDGGGKRTLDFRLSWTFTTAAEVEEALGLNLLTGEAWTKLSARNLGVMLWASLLQNHPEYGGRMAGESFADFERQKAERQAEGLEAVLSFIDLGNVDQVYDAVWNAYFMSLSPVRRQQLEANRKALMDGATKEARPLAVSPSPSDGSTSGPLPATISASASTSSESLPTLSLTPSSTATLSANAAICSAPEPSPQPSPIVLHSATPVGSL